MSPNKTPWTHAEDVEQGIYDDTKDRVVEQTVVASPPLAYIDTSSNSSLSSGRVYGDTKPRALHVETSMTSLWSPLSPIHEGITPFSSVPELSLQWPKGWQALDAAATVKFGGKKGGDDDPKADQPSKPPQQPSKPKSKPKVSFWVLIKLWFNTYRKFFTFVVSLNITGIVLAALGRFPYAENHLGALVLGNLLCAVLMRNELFLRFLYIISIYGLRSVSLLSLACTDLRTPNKAQGY